MVQFTPELKTLFGKEYPGERELLLYNAVGYLGEAFECERTKIVLSGGCDNSIFNVYYEGNLVFNISRGLYDAIKYYKKGEWEDEVLERYSDFDDDN